MSPAAAPAARDRAIAALGVLVTVGAWGAALASGFGAPASPALPWSSAPLHLASGAAVAGLAAVARGRGRRGALVSAVAGGLVGVLALAGRNAASDARAFSRAVASSDVAPLAAYVAAGGARRGEARDALLPRVELARLCARGTIEDLDRFAETHPGPLAAEARAAQPVVLRRELTASEASLARLRELLRKQPAAPGADAARARLREAHAAGRAALAVAPRGVASSDLGLRAAVVTLLDWTEANDGAPVPVRFRHRAAPSLASADGLLARGLLGQAAAARGGYALAGSHFTAAREDAREDAALLQIAAALSPETGLLPFARGPELPGGAPPPSPAAVPRAAHVALPEGDPGRASPAVLVDVEVGWSGNTFVGRQGGRRFLGVSYRFVVAVVTPGAAPYETEVHATPAPRIAVDYVAWDGDAGTPPLDDARAYDVMAHDAYAELGRALRALLDARARAENGPRD